MTEQIQNGEDTFIDELTPLETTTSSDIPQFDPKNFFTNVEWGKIASDITEAITPDELGHTAYQDDLYGYYSLSAAIALASDSQDHTLSEYLKDDLMAKVDEVRDSGSILTNSSEFTFHTMGLFKVLAHQRGYLFPQNFDRIADSVNNKIARARQQGSYVKLLQQAFFVKVAEKTPGSIPLDVTESDWQQIKYVLEAPFYKQKVQDEEKPDIWHSDNEMEPLFVLLMQAQLVFPERIRELSYFDTLTKNLLIDLNKPQPQQPARYTSLFKLLDAFSLQVITSGGFQRTKEGIEIIPYKPKITHQQITKPPEDFV